MPPGDEFVESSMIVGPGNLHIVGILVLVTAPRALHASLSSYDRSAST